MTAKEDLCEAVPVKWIFKGSGRLRHMKNNWGKGWSRQQVAWGAQGTSTAVSNFFGTRDQFCVREFFHWPRRRGWFGDDSTVLHLLCMLFLLHQLHFRSSGIRSQRSGSPDLEGRQEEMERKWGTSACWTARQGCNALGFYPLGRCHDQI